jgi:hypothetical protein
MQVALRGSPVKRRYLPEPGTGQVLNLLDISAKGVHICCANTRRMEKNVMNMDEKTVDLERHFPKDKTVTTSPEELNWIIIRF